MTDFVTRTTKNEEQFLVARLRGGDESAFTELVDRFHARLIHFTLGFVHSAAIAEDVVQDAWIGVIKGVQAFEGRSSLGSWIFGIAANKAKTRAAREARTRPFSSLAADEASDAAPAVDPDRFLDATSEWPGHWAHPPASWGDQPERRLLSAEVLEELHRIADGLPDAQRTVLLLRDVEGFDPRTVCNILGLSETNVRVLLHRARSKVRGALEDYLKP